MRLRRVLIPIALGGFVVTGCGSVQVQPKTPAGATTLATRGRLDDPATNVHNHLACLRDAHLPVQVVGPVTLQVGPAPAGPTIVFTPSPAVAQADQIEGRTEGAEVIGSAEVYPNQGSDGEMAAIGGCLAQGVQQ